MLRMYLKRLELNGFKSFAGFTELEFVPGVTAVVGPNGSGKSNVSDAVRWVLGEQSARSLRGGKMEDVIFAGSDSRHAVNFCEVSLTLDNSDGALPLTYSEITVTRRLYRSGESEYYLNRQLCRLRDISELFMDTGLGKEAYSMIGQGRIDEILSTKAEERRGIFEEAAGIVKFKVRKREAERKLEETEQNLARISDLIHELEGQTGPLAEQAEKARTFHQIQGQLKQCEVGLYVYRIEHVHGEWEQATAQLHTLEKETLALETELKQQEAAIEKQKWQLQQLDEKLEDEQHQLLVASEAVEKAEGHHEVLLERERNLQAERERFREQREHLRNRASHVQRDLEQTKEHLRVQEATIAETRRDLEQREIKLQRLAADAEAELENVKADLVERMGEAASLKNDLRYLEEQLQHNHDRQQAIRTEKAEAESLAADIRKKQIHLEQEQAQKVEQLQVCLADYHNLVKQRDAIVATERSQSQQMRELEQKLNRHRSRHEVLRALEADFSGYFQGVKEILKAREQGKLDGIEGAVAELLHVPPHLETAIETALGGALQHVVVHSEQHGRAAIDYLKKHRLGRATFLPLDVIRGRSLSAHNQALLARDDGFVGIGVDLVQFEPTYMNIVSSLLGHVIIAREMADANRLARLLQYRYRVVTLDGDLVHPGGSMSGGRSQKRRPNVIGRKRELEDLERQLEMLREERQALIASIRTSEQQKKAFEKQLETMRTRGEALRLDEQKLRGQLEHTQSEHAHVIERLEQLKKEQERLIAEHKQCTAKKNDVHARLAENDEAEQQLNHQLQQLEREMMRQKEQKEAESSQVTELKVLLAKKIQELEHLSENRKRLERELTSVKEEQQVLSQQTMELERRFVENDQEKANDMTRIQERRAARDGIERQLNDTRVARQQQQRQLDALDATHRDRRKTLQTIETKRQQQEVKANRLDVQLNNLLTALSEQYELSYERAKERYAQPEDPHQAEIEVKQLKERLASLGEVNLGAIDEYERVSERLNFLQKQQQDLMEAKATLYEVIHKMDKEMAERFKATFQAIRTQFQTVFVELFGGGRADLTLTDPDSLLDTGIDIVVQPPGKKRQHLSLLSGGERTLTAIVLMFAILRVKPVPFCILDEVEASLDEANVGRFARYLREFSGQTQFIVITHRKGTMEEADVLYGVTMEESGVSKLVSVKLDGTAPEVAASSE